MAGVCAAIAAARLGSKVVLIQDRPVLGGNASSEIKMHIVGADNHGNRPGARETGLLEEFRLEDAVRNPHRSYSQWDLLLYEKVIQEPNITLLLNAACVGCAVDGSSTQRRIRSIRVQRHSTEEEFEIVAPFYADCSGDGRLGLEAGADFRMGRECCEEFGETLAVEKADNQTLGSSILFTARQYEKPQPFRRPHWVRRFRKEEFKFRAVQSFEYGYWWAEWGGQLDTIHDNEKIRHELLRIALGIWDYVKNSGDHPDSAHWALDWVGAIPGKRESRRFLGPKILTQGDLESGRLYDDVVAYGGWWLDLHPPTGVDAINESPCVHHRIPLYGIPLRALYSRNVGNLFFAGRNMSATHVAFSSLRVMGTCAVMGQAVGAAAAMLREKVGMIGELVDKPAMKRIQQSLLRQDAYLPGIKNEDEHDLARIAIVTASSGELTVGRVVNGIARDTSKKWNSELREADNAWQSESLPAWMELSWDRPQNIQEIHLTFCTGLQRELILSPSDHVTSKSIRGAQPETAKQYRLLLDDQELVCVEDNYLRKRVHQFPQPITVRRLRLKIEATWGCLSASIYEIRAYATCQ